MILYKTVIHYNSDCRTRGPHAFWLSGKISESKSEADGLINLVHYDDAAEAIMSAFKSKVCMV